MGSTILCSTCKREDKASEIRTATEQSEKYKKELNESNADYAKHYFKSGAVSRSNSDTSPVINKSKFVGEKKTRITDDYELLEVLGEGSFGRVRKCKNKCSNRICAVKIIKKMCCCSDGNMLAEYSILKTLVHLW